MMERALKERIIGAIVLVIFVVLVVPVFLDGPPEGGEMISERVLLPGQDGQDTKTVVLERERTEPMPLASSTDNAARSREATAAEVVEEKPVPEPVAETQPTRTEQQSTARPQAEAPKPATSTTGMWAVQLGSFSNKENAEKLAADLRKQGYAAFLSQLQINSGSLHRVRIGPQKDRESAEAMAARLLKVGHKGQVLPHP
jgi:DedD protein